MHTVKFSSADKNQHEFVISLRKSVNEYFKKNNISTKANATMVIKSIILISLYLTPFIVLLSVSVAPVIAFGLVLIMGIGVAGIGMGIMHDACHGAYSKHQWVNHLMAGTIYLLGSNVLNWKIQHNVLHHTFTNLPGMDEDIDSKGPIRLSETLPLKKYHRFQYLYAFFFYGLMTLTTFFNDFTRLAHYNKSGLVKSQGKRLRREFLKMTFRKVIYLVVLLGLPLWLTEYNFWIILSAFVFMHWIASIILSFVFQMAHVVEGVAQPPNVKESVESEWMVHQLNTTADFAKNNKLWNWFLGGLNFQVEHHLFPNICHVHYKNIAPIVEKTAKQYGINYNEMPSFASAIASHFNRLKYLGHAQV